MPAVALAAIALGMALPRPVAWAAIAIYDAANFQVLVERYRAAVGSHAPDYSI